MRPAGPAFEAGCILKGPRARVTRGDGTETKWRTAVGGCGPPGRAYTGAPPTPIFRGSASTKAGGLGRRPNLLVGRCGAGPRSKGVGRDFGSAQGKGLSPLNFGGVHSKYMSSQDNFYLCQNGHICCTANIGILACYLRLEAYLLYSKYGSQCSLTKRKSSKVWSAP